MVRCRPFTQIFSGFLAAATCVWHAEALAELDAPPEPINQQEWFTSDGTYPHLVHQREDIELRFMLVVDRSGRVSDCIPVIPSGIRRFDEHVCLLVQHRARFIAGQPGQFYFSLLIQAEDSQAE